MKVIWASIPFGLPNLTIVLIELWHKISVWALQSWDCWATVLDHHCFLESVAWTNEGCDCLWWKLYSTDFSHFRLMQPCDRRMDGQTNGHVVCAARLSLCLSDQSFFQFFKLSDAMPVVTIKWLPTTCGDSQTSIQQWGALWWSG